MAGIPEMTIDQSPMRERLLFDRISDNPIPFNLTSSKSQVFGSILIAVGFVDLLATAFLLSITYVTTSMDGMKRSEKLLVCNVLVPDLILEMILCYYVGPATFSNAWSQGQTDTMWLAFLHSACIFHPPLANATVCYMIALSMTDAYRHEMANNMKHMCVVVMSTVTVTICFCSLPATEDKGYMLMENWLGPSFNTSFQYGSLFMCFGLLGLIVFASVISINRILEARKFLQEHRGKVSTRVIEELDQDLVYCMISLVAACLIFPLTFGLPDPTLMLVPRLVVYLLPFARVVALINTCPHFRFAYFGGMDVDDFAVLEGLDEEEMAQVAEAMEVAAHGGDEYLLTSTEI